MDLSPFQTTVIPYIQKNRNERVKKYHLDQYLSKISSKEIGLLLKKEKRDYSIDTISIDTTIFDQRLDEVITLSPTKATRKGPISLSISISE